MVHPYDEKPKWKYIQFSVPKTLSDPVQVMFLIKQSVSEQVRRQSQAMKVLVGNCWFSTP